MGSLGGIFARLPPIAVFRAISGTLHSAIGNPARSFNSPAVSYTVFARKYRPQTFDDVVGQEHITRTLRNAIEQKRLAHAYIFVGPRGTGKTSTARILAKSLNCQNAPGPTTQPCGKCDSCKEIAAGTSLDVLEFDAASNTQVDKVRELIIDNVKYAPTRGRFKVYIVDEVHMLSTSSFNALLKTLEEPPEHVKFLFATTDVQKVPTTIISRCQRFDLKRIASGLITGHLQEIAKKEKIDLSREAAEAVAHGAEGGMRDAESMLDQLVAFCGNKIEEADVLSVFGLTAQQTISDLCDCLIAGDSAGALGVVHEQAEAGRDLSRLMGDLITHLRNLLVSKADPSALANEMSEESVALLLAQAEYVKMDKVLELIEQLAAAEQRMKWAPNKKMHFEIAVIRAIQILSQATLNEVLETLAAIRGGGSVTSGTGGSPKPPAISRPKPAAARPARPAVARPPVSREIAAEPVPAPKAVEAAPAPVAEPAPAAPKEESAPLFSAVVAEPEPVVAAQPLAPEPAPLLELELDPEPEPEPIQAAPVEEPAPEVKPTPAVSQDLTAIWAKVVTEVRKRRPLIQGFVETGTLAEIDGDKAILAFPTDEKIAGECCQQPNNRKLLETIFAEICGREMDLKYEFRAGLEVPTVAQPEPEKPRDPEEDFKNDPLIRKALELFKAEIQPA